MRIINANTTCAHDIAVDAINLKSNICDRICECRLYFKFY